MKVRTILCTVPVWLLMAGCGLLPGMMPQQPAAEQKDPLAVSDESKRVVRQQEDAGEKIQAEAENEQIASLEKDVIKSLKMSLGQESTAPGMAMPESASTTLTALRKGNIKTRLQAVTDADGRPLNDNFLELKDSYTERVTALQRKMVEGTASAAEKKEIMDGAKHAMKLNDLRMAVSTISRVAMMTNSQLQTSELTTVLRVSGLTRSRQQMEMSVEEADYERIREWLTRLRRVENCAAASLGSLAIYQAVVNGKGDPKVLDSYATKALEAFSTPQEATLQEAKDYANNLKGNISQVKQSYEQMMRKAHGDAKYETRYKASIDGMFRQMEQQGKTPREVAADAKGKYDADLENCAQGKAAGPGSLVSGPMCEEARKARLEGRPIKSAGTPVAQAPSTGGLVDSLMGSIPGLNVVQASLNGIQALAKGDTKGAITAAVGLVPGGGPVKDALGIAMKLI